MELAEECRTTGDFATHCRKKVQTVCSSVPKIKTGIKLEGDRRFEKQYMELAEECRTTVVGQQCAPINCKFLDLGEDCVVNTKTIDITLTDRVCNICKPRVAEQVSLKEVCKQGSTKRCEDAPIEQLWKKFCTTKTTNTNKKENSVELTLVNILDPVDDLFDQKLNINDGTRTINDSKDNFREPKSNIDSSIKFKFTSSIEEKAAVKKKLHDLEQLDILPARRRPQASVYFNQNDQYIPVLNSRSENKQEINAESTILEKFSEEELQISSHTTENYISASNITLSGSLSVDAFNTTTSIINIPKETTTVSSTSTTKPSNNEEKTTSLYSSHNPDVATENSIFGKDKKNSTSGDQIIVSKQMINTVVNYSDNEIEDEKNMITKEEFLKSCFLFGIGCDFNPKNIDDSLLHKTTTTESTVHLLKYEPYMESHDHEQQLLSQLDCLFKHNCPPKDQIYPSTLSTSTKPPKKAKLQFEASTEGNQKKLEQHKEEYKDSVSRLKCLFNGSCDPSGVKRRRPTTTTTPAGPTLSQRERRLEEEIRSRATNCFLRGVC